jgi:hypothetical protein
MIQLDCVLARMSPVAIPDWLTTEPGQLVRAFANGSSNDIRLRLRDQLRESPVGSSGVVGAYDLHEATLSLSRNPPPPERVRTVAVLFAGTYSYPGRIFGIMFDRGFTTDDDPNANSDYTGHPREACAVFLDKIRAHRTPGEDFELETRFTTIHEVGHLFNLQHTTRPCFMASSPPNAPHAEDTHFRFTDEQRQALSSCSTSSSVWPGGAHFGDTGPFSASNAKAGRRRKLLDGLELRVGLPNEAFWAFEPVELDVELRVRRGANRRFQVPDRLDAGYEEFRVWIEEPNGERRIYRSPRHYCAAPARRAIGPGSGFERDISLFGESGGYTFRRAGVHRVWAEFMARRGEWLTSNVVECDVLPADRSKLYSDARHFLSRANVSRLLYHRRVPRRMRVSRLEDFVRSYPRWEGMGRVEYGIGRAFLSAAERRTGSEAKIIRGLGADHLQRALDRPGLGGHQRLLAARILDESLRDM